jgi:hypothetical protein
VRSANVVNAMDALRSVQRGVHDAFAEWLAPWPEIADRYRPRFTFEFRSDHSSRAPPALEL